MAKKTAEKATPTFTPYLRYKTISYIEADAPEGAEPWDITMRSDLTMEEVESILPDKDSDMTNAELWDLVAPHVVKWPFRDPRTGDDIPPPAEGGGAMFKKVPVGVFHAVLNDLIRVNAGRVDPKSSSAPITSVSTTSESDKDK